MARVAILYPFRRKFLKLLEGEFPQVAFVEGTHDAKKGTTPEEFVEALKSLLFSLRQYFGWKLRIFVPKGPAQFSF